MKRKSRGFRKMMLCAVAILLLGVLSGCHFGTDPELRKEKGTSADFARAAAEDVTLRLNSPNLLYVSGNVYIDPELKPSFQPYFAMEDFKAVQDENDPELVHYTCKIPGLVGMVYNAAFNTCFTTNTVYSPFFETEGTLRVVRDGEGNRVIDVSDEEIPNVFTLYAALRYPNPLFFSYNGVDLSGGVTSDNRVDVLKILLNNGSLLYANALGQDLDAYVNETVIPELEKYNENFSKNIAPYRNEHGYGVRNALMTSTGQWIILGVAAVVALILFFLVYKVWKKIRAVLQQKGKNAQMLREVAPGVPAERRKELLKRCGPMRYMKVVNGDAEAVRGLHWKNDREILDWVIHNGRMNSVNAAVYVLPYPEAGEMLAEAARKGTTEALKKLPYPEERKTLRALALDGDVPEEIRAGAVEKLSDPEDREVLEQLAGDAAVAVATAALEKLPGENFEKRLLEYYRNAKEENRLAVLVRLPYTEETAEELRRTALEAEDEKLRKKAAEKLPYPLEREVLLTVAEKDPDSDCRLAALERLPVEQETQAWERAALEEPGSSRFLAVKEVASYASAKCLSQILEKDSDADSRRIALEALTWENGAEALSRAALKDPDGEVQKEAVGKLKVPEATETLEKVALEAEHAETRRAAVRRLAYPGSRKILTEAALKDSDGEVRKLARERLPWLKESEVWGRFVTDPINGLTSCFTQPTDEDRIRAAISVTFRPFRSDELERKFCEWIEDGRSNPEDGTARTLSGWSAAALGRILSREMKLEAIADSEKALRRAMDSHNADAEKARALQKQLEPYEGKQLNALPSADREKAQRLLEKLHSLGERMHRGLGVYMLENGDRPFSYLTFILRDNQTRVARFVKQGVIMGLVDWLAENSAHPEAKKLLDAVLNVRADLIRSDNELSFYEVRVPADCEAGDFAKILQEVLHCANPSVPFCDTKKLLEIACKEVPGCMEMLRKCPLRLIDPVNRQTLGFYQFKPYIHAMWVQYRPPKDTGKVISRTHEVDDRTRPLSSGLNLKLFLDPYAVIPTLFHEYQHFTGDPNEASVFLKTQLFSIRFYKRYRNADAAADDVFARMTEMLGLPPAAEKVETLNDTIRKYYGEQVKKEDAEKNAEQELEKMNQYISFANMMEKWDPQVTFPLLNNEGDKRNAELIRNIIVRYATVPKSITRSEFSEILRSAEK